MFSSLWKKIITNTCSFLASHGRSIWQHAVTRLSKRSQGSPRGISMQNFSVEVFNGTAMSYVSILTRTTLCHWRTIRPTCWLRWIMMIELEFMDLISVFLFQRCNSREWANKSALCTEEITLGSMQLCSRWAIILTCIIFISWASRS